MRRSVGIVVGALLATFLIVAPTSASSATSWRAMIAGTSLHGGATTLIRSDGTGSINVTLRGVTPGERAAIIVMPSACPDESQDLFSFELPAARADGTATGRHTLTTREVRAYDAARSRRAKIALLVVTSDDKGCGDQVGAPSVGTARVQGSKADVYRYDLRYPVVGGIDLTAAAEINGVLRGHVDAVIADVAARARQAGDHAGLVADIVETFSVRFSQSGLLSIFVNSDDAAGVDATSFPVAFTFETATGRRLMLDDIVADRAALQADVRRVLARRGPLYASQANIHDDTPWVIVPAGIALTFGSLQAAGISPYTAVVPWAMLRPILVAGTRVAALAGPAPCQAAQLRSTIDPWEGGAGSRFTRVHLTNVSAASCFLQGTPQSQLLDATGRVLLDSGRAGAAGLPHVAPGDPRVTVAPGGSARIDVQTNNYCGPAPVDFVRIALRLPGGTARVISWHAPGPTLDEVPPCLGPTAPGVITTNGWHHG
jgi:hypothetical protein